MRHIYALVVVCIVLQVCLAQIQQNVYTYIGRGFDLVAGDLRPTNDDDGKLGHPKYFHFLNAGSIKDWHCEITLTWNKALIYEIEATTDGTPTETLSYENTTFDFYTARTPREFSVRLLEDVNVVDLAPEIGFGNNGYSNMVSRTIMNQGNTVYTSSAEVALFKASMLRANVSQSFMDDVKALPTSYNYNDYLNFISKYGTHYVRNATFGGRITAYASIPFFNRGQLLNTKTDILNGLRITARYQYTIADETSSVDYQRLSAAGVGVNLYSVGGDKSTKFDSWKTSIEQNPMPISLELDPYVFLIEDASIRENMVTALQKYMNGSIGFDNTIQTAPVDPANFTSLWASYGSPVDVNVSCWRYAEFDGYRRIGDICNDTANFDLSLQYVKEIENDAALPRYPSHKPMLAYPLSFLQIWIDSGSNAILDGGFWAPICPTGYVPVGHISKIDHDPPLVSDQVVTCVHARCAESCNSNYLWQDDGSKAIYDVLLRTPAANITTQFSTGGFFGFPTYDPSLDDLLNVTCLKKVCLGTPESYPANFSVAIAALWSAQPLSGILFSRRNETTPASPDGLSGGIIAAIVVPIGVVVGVGIFLIVFFVVVKPKQKKKKHPKDDETPLEDTNYVSVPIPGVDNVITNGSNKSNRWELSPNDVLLQTKLGQGSFGVVWRGKLNRVTDVAVKVTQNESSKTSAEMIKEAQVMAELRPHPNIVQLFGVYTHEEKFHLVMEYCSKGSLETYLKSYSLDGKTIRNLLRGIASGMSHLHSQNVIHRDLATRNILLTDTGVPKISDFGMARIVGIDNTGKTLNTIGPVKWMSPESLMTREYSNKSDVWSFGVTAWEMIYGREPYENWDLLELALKIRETNMHPDISTCSDEFLKSLMLKCWTPDPKVRPSFEDLVEILNEEMGGEELHSASVHVDEQNQQPPQSNYSDAVPSSSSNAEGPYSAIDTSSNLKISSQPGSQEGTKYKGMPSKDDMAKVAMSIDNSTIHELPEEKQSSDSGSSSESSESSSASTGVSSS